VEDGQVKLRGGLLQHTVVSGAVLISNNDTATNQQRSQKQK